ncbi:MAG: CBS domain-containing protein [Oligoflexia bacterium]|nr:CBS domain-containing protein [Oligoflexia bacterium]
MKKTPAERLNEILNIQVEEYSTPCTVTAQKATKIDELANLMKENSVRHIPIIENDDVVGIVSDRDISNLPEGSDAVAALIMSKDVYTTESHALLKDVVFEMSSKKIGSAMVIDQSDKSLSIFTSVDALNALNEILGGGNF